jgi:hypothetical protein
VTAPTLRRSATRLSKKRVPTCQADLSGEHLATPAVLKGCKLTPKLRQACRRAPARQVPARLAAVGGDERMGLKACSQPAVAVDGRLSMRHRARVPRFECWNGGRKIPAKFVWSKFVSSAKGWIVDAVRQARQLRFAAFSKLINAWLHCKRRQDV